MEKGENILEQLAAARPDLDREDVRSRMIAGAAHDETVTSIIFDVLGDAPEGNSFADLVEKDLHESS